MASESAILGWMLLLPAVGGGLIFALPQVYAKKARPIALAIFGATFVLACIASGWFDWGNSGEVQLATHLLWLATLGSSFHLAVDGLSMPLVLLTSGMGVVACWASYGINRSPRGYFAMLLWLTTALLGAFTARDLLLLLVFFELAVPPIYFLIGIWGGGRKDYSASKFLLFALIGSVGMLLAIVSIYHATEGLGDNEVAPPAVKATASTTGTRQAVATNPAPATVPAESASGENRAQPNPGVFDLLQLTTDPTVQKRLASGFGIVTFWLLVVAFAIWMGAAPLHTWLSDAIAEAPTPVAMLLIAVVTKLGIYGMIRVAYPLFAAHAAERWECIAALGIISMFYGTLAALVQKDLRRVIAFASIAQMGAMLLGLAVLTPAAMAGVSYQLVAHGITMGMLIFITGMISDRAGHCDLRKLGGLAGHMPIFSGWSAVGFLSAMGLPGLCGFMGEFLILLGTFMAADSQSLLTRTLGTGIGGPMMSLAVLGAAAMVITAACFIWTYQRVFLGAPKPEHSNVARLSSSEKWILATFGAASISLGIMPGILTEPMRGWVEGWIRLMTRV